MSAGMGSEMRSGLINPEGLETDFLRPKMREKRFVDPVSCAVAVAPAGATVEVDELLRIVLSSARGAMDVDSDDIIFSMISFVESLDPVRRRPRLGLRKMVLPMMDLSL